MGVQMHGVKLTAADTDAKFRLGMRWTDEAGEYEYAQADGAIDRGALCKIILTVVDGKVTNAQADECTTAESGSTGKRLGVAQATLADNEYGWFWRGNGQTEALVQTGVSADTNLTTTTTAGELGTGGDAVVSLTALDGNSSGLTALVTVVAYSLIGSN